MRKLTYILALLVLSFDVGAQDLATDFNKMNKAYENCNTISMELTYNVFFDGNTRPSESEKGIIKRAKENIYANEFSQETVINNKYIVTIDHAVKVIEVEHKLKNNLPQKTVQIETDSLLKYFNTIEYKGISDGGKHYVLTNTLGEIASIEIWLNQKTLYIEKLRTSYRNKMEVEKGKFSNVISEITYSNVKVNETLPVSIFSIEKFIKVTGNKVVLATKYKDYELINQLKN